MKNQKINSSAGARDFFRSVPPFSVLPDEDIDSLIKIAHQSDYKKGEYLYRQGEDADRLSIVRSGWIRLYRSNYDGEEGAARLCTRGDLLGERVLLPGNLKHFFSAQIIGDTSIINIPAPVLKDVVRRHPAVLSKMMLGLMQKIGKIHVESEHVALLSASQRVACLLLRLSSHMIGNGGTFTFPYDKSLAAAELGMKRETFSRALGALKEEGVSSCGPEVTIENFARLSQSCCLRCSLNTECKGARGIASEPVKNNHRLAS